MTSPLKNVYSPAFYEQLADGLETVIDGFDRLAFRQAIFSPAFDGMELGQRMTHTIDRIAEWLPADLSEVVGRLDSLVDALRAACRREQSFEYLMSCSCINADI